MSQKDNCDKKTNGTQIVWFSDLGKILSGHTMAAH